MDHQTFFILLIIFLAFLFDFINGFHDAANSIATIVTTGVLSPREAVLWAAFFNFIAFLFFNLMVAKTIGNGLIDPHIIDSKLIFSALIGAIFWNLLTWFFGLPSSSSHALIGGLAGAAIMRGGLATLQMTGFVKIGIGILLSPLIGLVISLLISYLISYFLLDNDKHKSLYKAFQLASSALLSLSHGSNDAQKTMGVIAVLLFSNAWYHGPFHVPCWVVISCQAVISLGTLVGGWRIVYTMGHRITQLNPLRGCIAESSAAAIILASTELGIPVSSTQTVTGAIAGVGMINGFSGSKWSMLRLIFLSWVFTIPASGVVSAIIMKLIH